MRFLCAILAVLIITFFWAIGGYTSARRADGICKALGYYEGTSNFIYKQGCNALTKQGIKNIPLNEAIRKSKI